MKSVLFHITMCLVLVTILGTPQTLIAQEQLSWYRKLGDDLFRSGAYEQALETYRSYQNANSIEYPEILLHMAISCYHLNRLHEGRRYLHALLENPLHRPIDPQTFLYLGKIAHAELQFKEAVKFYKTFLKQQTVDEALRVAVKKDILHCGTALRLGQHPDLMYVKGLGELVNTRYDEYGSVSSPNYDNRIYFSSIRSRQGESMDPVTQDSLETTILYTQTVNGEWYPAQPLAAETEEWEELLGFNADGTQLFYRGQSIGRDSAIYVNAFGQNGLDEALPLPVDIAAGDCDFRFFADSLLLFSSKRPEGQGGYDLYWSSYQNGQWSVPKNLGPQVNSIWDERTPFLANDQRTLYFSSNNPRQGVGGFDIFRVAFNNTSRQWLAPENMGLLINSAADDTHFHLTNDAYRAFFTSSRKEGVGGQDLYAAYFDKARPEMLAENAVGFHHILNNRAVVTTEPKQHKPPFPSFSFSAKEAFKAAANADQLQQLLSLLQKSPSHQALLHATTTDNLVQALDALERLAGILLQQNIDASRIQLQVVRQSAPEESLTVFVFPPLNQQPLEQEKPLPLLHPSAGMWQGFTYRVQVPADTAAPDNLKPELLECQSLSDSWYTFGSYRTAAAARQLRSELEKRGTRSVNVQVYWHGWKLSPEEADFVKATCPYLW